MIDCGNYLNIRRREIRLPVTYQDTPNETPRRRELLDRGRRGVLRAGQDADSYGWRDLAAGLLGGLAGTVAMSGFQTAWDHLRKRKEDDSDSRSREARNPFEEKPATVKAANAISRKVFQHELSESQEKPAGRVVHYGFGALNGLAYQAISRKVSLADPAQGVLFGAALFYGRSPMR